MKKYALLAIALGLLMVGSMLMVPAYAAPTITNPMKLIEATIEGGNPLDVDPAVCYDTASAEMIQNVYDTLLSYNGEHYDEYIPVLASSWTGQSINETSPEGLHWYYRYTFTLRNWANMTFAPPYNYPITAADIEYSFEREMVMDFGGGPQWMLYEPLLNQGGGAAALGNMSDPADIAKVGKMIDHAVQQDGTHVWFNIAFPGPYVPFLQILTQSWSSILSKQWIINYVIGTEHRPEWNGDFGPTYTDWINYWNPDTSPLESPTGLMYGSGPFRLTTWDTTNMYWEMERNVDYWRGWPAEFPTDPAHVSPRLYGGYVNTIKCTWAYTWATRKGLFLSGDVDFCAVPPANRPEIYQSPSPPYDPPNYPLDGIQCIHPLPALSCDGMFFQYSVSLASPYGSIGPAGVFYETGIPQDFFGNETWGIHVRKAFAYAFDYDTYITTGLLGEATRPHNAIIPGLPGNYYNDSIPGYIFNETRAIEEMHQVPELWDTGFTLVVLYNTGNLPRLTAANLIVSGINNMNNTKFHVSVTAVDWGPYLRACYRHYTPLFIIGWIADYPDAHNFAFAFYNTYGAFAGWQQFSDEQMDDWINTAITLPDGPGRAALYNNVQQRVFELCPNVIIDQPIGRHFQRDWVVGWYYNPIYPGNYFYNLWKWYYVPHALQSTPTTQPMSYSIGVDINYDGKVDIKDVSAAAKSFGTVATPPIDPRWVFRADFNGDRKIDIKDISAVAKRYGSSSPVWTPSP